MPPEISRAERILSIASAMIDRFATQAGYAFQVTKHDYAEIEWFGEHAPRTYQDLLEKRLRQLPYQKFLRTFYWRAIRSHLLSRAQGRCRSGFECHERSSLEVHHRTYEHRGREHLHLGDLSVLCDECHRRLHGLVEEWRIREIEVQLRCGTVRKTKEVISDADPS